MICVHISDILNTVFFQLAYILHLTAISINRYLLICQQEVYDKIYCSRNVSIMISGIWLFSFAFLLLPLFGIWGQIGKL